MNEVQEYMVWYGMYVKCMSMTIHSDGMGSEYAEEKTQKMMFSSKGIFSRDNNCFGRDQICTESKTAHYSH